VSEIQNIIDRMVEHSIRERLMCCGLLDQNRYIGGDPVGHCCSNPSEETVWQGGVNWRLCRPCADLFRENSPRLTVMLHHGRLGGEQ
jgi:hypothetical protein